MTRPFRRGRRALLLLLLLAPAPAIAGGSEAGVATSEAEATRVAGALLRAGGNAVDAAVGAALALAVVHPEAGNLGGGGFAVVRLGDEVAALDFREVAPAAATPTMFLDAAGEPRPGASLIGPLAAAVPGSPAGYFELHRRFGRLPWAAVVEPATELARSGFAVSWATARSLAETRDDLARFPESAETWLPGGLPLGAGERLRLPALARTLERYAEVGPAAITAGGVAAAIERASLRHGGVLTARDLAAFRPTWREPLRFDAFGWSFAAMPLPATGGQVVAETLGLLERRGWAELPAESAARVHLLIEAWRTAFADRFELGDPSATRRTLAALLAPARLDALALALPDERARSSTGLGPGSPADEPRETTHVSVVDGDGGAVALTTTLNELFGCALWIPEAGIFLNDQMDDFTTAPGRPNDYGLVQGEANRVRPGLRPLSSMAPTLAWRGEERIVLGGRGGPRIPTAIVQVLLRLWEGDAPAAAVARPRLHHQWLPDRVEAEDGALAAAVRADLERRGHTLVEPRSRARVNAVRRAAGGGVEAGADPRSFEVAMHFELPAADDVGAASR